MPQKWRFSEFYEAVEYRLVWCYCKLWNLTYLKYLHYVSTDLLHFPLLSSLSSFRFTQEPYWFSVLKPKDLKVQRLRVKRLTRNFKEMGQTPALSIAKERFRDFLLYLAFTKALRNSIIFGPFYLASMKQNFICFFGFYFSFIICPFVRIFYFPNNPCFLLPLFCRRI